MAEKKRFELLEGYKPSPVFKTGAFGHSATSPHYGAYTTIFRLRVNLKHKIMLIFNNLEAKQHLMPNY